MANTPVSFQISYTAPDIKAGVTHVINMAENLPFLKYVIEAALVTQAGVNRLVSI